MSFGKHAGVKPQEFYPNEVVFVFLLSKFLCALGSRFILTCDRIAKYVRWDSADILACAGIALYNLSIYIYMIYIYILTVLLCI